MYDPKSAAEPANDAPEHEPEAGQADELDRGTGLGKSGGGLGKTTGFWSEKPMIDDLKKSGADPDFDKSLDEGKKSEN